MAFKWYTNMLRISYLRTSNGKHSECLCAFCMLHLAVLTCRHFCAHSVYLVCLKRFVASEYAALHMQTKLVLLFARTSGCEK